MFERERERVEVGYSPYYRICGLLNTCKLDSRVCESLLWNVPPTVVTSDLISDTCVALVVDTRTTESQKEILYTMSTTTPITTENLGNGFSLVHVGTSYWMVDTNNLTRPKEMIDWLDNPEGTLRVGSIEFRAPEKDTICFVVSQRNPVGITVAYYNSEDLSALFAHFAEM
jgi:hypothetical protein